jgi:hypothetical protein
MAPDDINFPRFWLSSRRPAFVCMDDGARTLATNGKR